VKRESSGTGLGTWGPLDLISIPIHVTKPQMFGQTVPSLKIFGGLVMFGQTAPNLKIFGGLVMFGQTAPNLKIFGGLVMFGQMAPTLKYLEVW
jgi:hypothetical protein